MEKMELMEAPPHFKSYIQRQVSLNYSEGTEGKVLRTRRKRKGVPPSPAAPGSQQSLRGELVRGPQKPEWPPQRPVC